MKIDTEVLLNQWVAEVGRKGKSTELAERIKQYALRQRSFTPRLNQTKLAKELGTKSNNVCKKITKFEQAGLIARQKVSPSGIMRYELMINGVRLKKETAN